MNRIDIINYLIKKYEYKSYLEIGVAVGVCFDAVICDKKIGVDPGNQYKKITHNVTSDIFFQTNRETFDIIFIDGFHEEEQIIRDIQNSLTFLNSGGMIVCHDMNPESEKSQEDPHCTNGNCWRGWVRLRQLRDDLDMKVVDVDHGCGIIRRGFQQTIFVENLTYADLIANKKEWLALISKDEFLSLY